jgi:hypothetical protein
MRRPEVEAERRGWREGVSLLKFSIFLHPQSFAAHLQLLTEFDDCGAGAAFLMGGLLDAGYMGVGPQVLA